MTGSGDERDPFESAVEAYLALLEAGTPPDTDEFCNRHPECANELREFIANLNFVDDQLAEARIRNPLATTTDLGQADLGQTDAGDTEAEQADASDSPDYGLATGTPLPKVHGYTLLSELGGGSQGIIYKAQEPRTKRIVALKVIREGAFATDFERLRFQNEIEVASSLTHPAIVRVYRSGEDHGRSFFTMEYIDGVPVDEYTASRTLSIEDTLQLFLGICDGAAYGHRRGVIHRDLKPSKILIDDDGHPHILDFGLPNCIAGGGQPATGIGTPAGVFVGVRRYAAPEQMKCGLGAIDIRTDVYALGVILYEMLTDGYPYPWDGGCGDDMALHVLQTPPTPPRAMRSELRGKLETIMLRAIHKEPDHRYQSAADLAEDIRHYLTGFPIGPRPNRFWYVFWYVARLAYRRHRLFVLAGATALVALIAFLITTWVL